MAFLAVPPLLSQTRIEGCVSHEKERVFCFIYFRRRSVRRSDREPRARPGCSACSSQNPAHTCRCRGRKGGDRCFSSCPSREKRPGHRFKRSEFAKPGQRSGSHSAPHSASASAGQNDRERFPADLAYLGGTVLPFAQSHPIFLLPNGSCPVATCWGDPDSFLTDFADSELAHITD